MELQTCEPNWGAARSRLSLHGPHPYDAATRQANAALAAMAPSALRHGQVLGGSDVRRTLRSVAQNVRASIGAKKEGAKLILSAEIRAEK